jgi:hypothetical protein
MECLRQYKTALQQLIFGLDTAWRWYDTYCILQVVPVLTDIVLFHNTSITVHWSVFGGFEEHAVNSTVGTVNNGYEFFWIFKDAGRCLYKVDNWTSNSIFWAY